jgi:zinc transport system substrate-binding protein
MKTRKTIVLLIAGLLTFLLLIGCSAQKKVQTNLESNKILVYASIYPMYDFANEIGRDRINLKLLTPPGVEPHDWEPTAKLVAEMEKADVFIYNGAGMESWADKLIGVLEAEDLVVVEASSGIDLLKTGEHEHSHAGSEDPHVWLDPINAKKQAKNIKDALIKADSSNREFYETNYNEFVDKLTDLHNRYQETLKNTKKKKIVVAHAAFGYLAQRYGLEQIPILGLSPQEEPTPSKMAQIAEICRKHNVKYIFFETLTNPKLAKVLAEETGAETAVLNPVGGLTEQEMKDRENYLSIMSDNLDVLKKALGE